MLKLVIKLRKAGYSVQETSHLLRSKLRGGAGAPYRIARTKKMIAATRKTMEIEQPILVRMESACSSTS